MRTTRLVSVAFGAVLAVAPVTNAIAAVWIVDGDASCPGDGTPGTPHCSLQDALDNPRLAPGDQIQLLEAETAYAGATAMVSGTEAMPIVVEASAGHTPTIGETLVLEDVSHWTVQGLTFDLSDSGGNDSAILITAAAPALAEGIVVRNNVISGWSPDSAESFAPGISVRSTGPETEPAVVGVVVADNRLSDGPGEAIAIERVRDAMIEGNTIDALHCGTLNGTTLMGDPRPAVQTAIRFEGVRDGVATRNRVTAFDTTQCSDPEPPNRLIGILVKGGRDGLVTYNYVTGIRSSDSASHQGIEVSSAAQNWIIARNIVTDVGTCGICLGVDFSSPGDDMRVLANTVIAWGDHALLVNNNVGDLEGLTVANNIFAAATTAQVAIGSDDGITSFDYNLYWDPEGERVGSCGAGDATDLAQWQADCGFDEHAVFADPRLPAARGPVEDFTPIGPDNPAVDAGDTLVGYIEEFHGEAADIGALEAPIPVGAEVLETAPSVVRLTIESNVSGGLIYDGGCEGFSVTADDEAVSLAECSRASEDLIELELGADLVEGQVARLRYDGLHITDEAAIGGTIGARMQPFDLEIDNAAPPADDDDGGDGGDTTGGGGETSGPGEGDGDLTTGDAGDSSGTSAGMDGGAPLETGCSCRTTPGRSGWTLGLWCIVVLTTRRSSSGTRRASRRRRATATCSRDVPGRTPRCALDPRSAPRGPGRGCTPPRSRLRR